MVLGPGSLDTVVSEIRVDGQEIEQQQARELQNLVSAIKKVRIVGKGEWSVRVLREEDLSANNSGVRKSQSWKRLGTAFCQREWQCLEIRKHLASS